jgi:hypothetical protein
MNHLIGFEPVSERICKIRIKFNFYNMKMIATHASVEEKDDQIKEKFHNSLERVYDTTPNYDMNVVTEDFNAKVGKEQYLAPVCGRYSLHDETNGSGRKMVDFSMGKDLTIKMAVFCVVAPYRLV